MRDLLVYDLPVRIFHWLFATLFVATIVIAKFLDSEELFHFHMITGLCLGFLALLRLIWGFVGSKHARFSTWPLHPKDLIGYFVGILSGDRRKWAGHNPASSWSGLAMIVLALMMVTSGLMTVLGLVDDIGEVHEFFGNAFLIVALSHIAGIALHTYRHQEWIGLSMITGKKEDVLREDAILSSNPLVALVFVLIVSLFTFHLVQNFDSANKTLTIFGTTLNLGEE